MRAGSGSSVVVTDHHEPPAVLPEAYAIVNPLQPGCAYPFKHLAGVGVTFKLVQQLLSAPQQELRLALESDGEDPQLGRAKQYLDVVALGTIADAVPLVGRTARRASGTRSAQHGDLAPGCNALLEESPKQSCSPPPRAVRPGWRSAARMWPSCWRRASTQRRPHGQGRARPRSPARGGSRRGPVGIARESGDPERRAPRRRHAQRAGRRSRKAELELERRSGSAQPGPCG
jgi:hypothetical protein